MLKLRTRRFKEFFEERPLIHGDGRFPVLIETLVIKQASTDRIKNFEKHLALSVRKSFLVLHSWVLAVESSEGSLRLFNHVVHRLQSIPCERLLLLLKVTWAHRSF